MKLMIGRRAAQTRYQWLSCLATHGTQATQRAHRVRHLTLRRAEQSRFRPTALIWTRLHQAGQESMHRQARTDERGGGGAGHRMHTRHTTPTSEAQGRKTPAPPPPPATFVMIESRSTCKSKRQKQRGRADRLRFMLTQVTRHRARS